MTTTPKPSDAAIAKAFWAVAECSYARDGVGLSLFDGVRKRAAAIDAEQPQGEQPAQQVGEADMQAGKAVAWIGKNPRSGEPEMCVHRPAASVMRDFQMRPLMYADAASAPFASSELIARARLSVGYSENYASANPRLLSTPKEHILGLCGIVRALIDASRAPAEQPAQGVPGFDVPWPVDSSEHTAYCRGWNDCREAALAASPAPAAVPYDEDERAIGKVIDERDRAHEVIDQLCDAVLGADRREWSSAYDFADAVEDVKERLAAPAAVPEGGEDALLTAIVRDVAELPDRTSPSDAPDMMLVSANELAAILRSRLASRQHGGARVPVPDGFYLASFKHGGQGYLLWWMPDNAGYTNDLEQAGIYTELTPGYHDSEHTVPVPVRFIERLRVRRLVDQGDSLNGSTWTAEKLRSAIAAAPAQEGS